VDDREQDVHEHGGGDDSVQEPEERSEQPALVSITAKIA
jgi:hypothetical protein